MYIGIGIYSEFLVSDRYRFWKSDIEAALLLSLEEIFDSYQMNPLKDNAHMLYDDRILMNYPFNSLWILITVL